jgi:hypothetical protein
MGGGYSQNVGLELAVASGQLLILTMPPFGLYLTLHTHQLRGSTYLEVTYYGTSLPT